MSGSTTNYNHTASVLTLLQDVNVYIKLINRTWPWMDMSSTTTAYTTLVTEAPNVDEEQSDIPQHLISDYVEIAQLAIVALFGTTTNLIVLRKLFKLFWIRTKTKHLYDLKSAFMFLKIQMTIANLLVCGIVAPWRFIWLWTYQWYGGDFLCRFANFLFMFSLNIGSNLVAAIAIDRARIVKAMVDANKPGGTVGNISKNCMRWVYVFVAVAYILAIITSGGQWFVFSTLRPHEDLDWEQCVSIWHKAMYLEQKPNFFISLDAYQIMHLVVLFWAPFTVISLCYAYIGTVLCAYGSSGYTQVKKGHGHAVRTVGHSDVELKSAYKTDTSSIGARESPDTVESRLATPNETTNDNSSKQLLGSPSLHPTGSSVCSSNGQSNGGAKPRSRRVSTSVVPAWRSQLKSKMFVISASVIGCYLLFFLPYNVISVYSLVDQTMGKKMDDYIWFLKSMIFFNSVVNPFIYGRGED